MLVYSTVLHLRCDIEQVRAVVAGWLSSKMRVPIHQLELAADGSQWFERHHLQNVTWLEGEPRQQAIAYEHPDLAVRGRMWIAEFGLQQTEPHLTRCSIVLRTEEKSILAQAPIPPTRPRIVKDLVQQCTPVDLIGDDGVFHLRANYAEFSDFVFDEARRLPIVLVSPTKRKTHLLDIDILVDRLLGAAHVAVIEPECNTYQLAGCVGEQYSAWNGAVNVLYPMFKGNVATWRLLRDDLETMFAAVESRPEDEILALITDRMNLVHLKDHFSCSDLREAKRLWLHQLAEETKTGNGEDLLTLYEEEIELLKGAKEQVEQERNDYYEAWWQGEAEKETLKQKLYDSENRVTSIKQHLSDKTIGASVATANHAFRCALLNIVHERARLCEVLQVIQQLYPDRVLFLEDAFIAAEASSEFKYAGRAFHLLEKLATTYWEALVEGVGDTKAREIFGDAYAARESETAMGNKGAMERRTFLYQGIPTPMFKHLRIGVKDGAADTLRVHFHWDHERQLIVVGHCGKHLDFK